MRGAGQLKPLLSTNKSALFWHCTCIMQNYNPKKSVCKLYPQLLNNEWVLPSSIFVFGFLIVAASSFVVSPSILDIVVPLFLSLLTVILVRHFPWPLVLLGDAHGWQWCCVPSFALRDLGRWHPSKDVWFASVGTLWDAAFWRRGRTTILVVVGVLFFQMEVQLVLMNVCLVAAFIRADIWTLGWGSWRCCWNLYWFRGLVIISQCTVVHCRRTWIL